MSFGGSARGIDVARCLQGQGEYALIMNEDEAVYLAAVLLSMRCAIQFSRGIGDAMWQVVPIEFVEQFTEENAVGLNSLEVLGAKGVLAEVQRIKNGRKKQGPKPVKRQRQRRKNPG